VAGTGIDFGKGLGALGDLGEIAGGGPTFSASGPPSVAFGATFPRKQWKGPTEPSSLLDLQRSARPQGRIDTEQIGLFALGQIVVLVEDREDAAQQSLLLRLAGVLAIEIDEERRGGVKPGGNESGDAQG
jgi:hypothetical protein